MAHEHLIFLINGDSEDDTWLLCNTTQQLVNVYHVTVGPKFSGVGKHLTNLILSILYI